MKWTHRLTSSTLASTLDEHEPGHPVLRLVGLAWSIVVLLLLGLMVIPVAYAAKDAVLRH